MLKTIISIILSVSIGIFWYSYNYGLGKAWASNAWPSKSYEDLLKFQSDSSSFIYGVTLLSESFVMIIFNIIIR